MALATLTIDVVARGLAQFQTDLGRVAHVAEDAANRMKASFGAITELLVTLGVGFGIERFTEQIHQAIDSITELGRVSERTGIDLEALSGLKLAAATVHLSFDDLQTALDRFSKSSDQAKISFQRLGIALVDINGQQKSQKQLLDEVANKFASFQDGAGKAAIAIDLFGRAGARLIPVLNQGSAGFAAFAEESKKLGTSISGESLEAAKRFEEQFALLKAAAEGFKIAIANEVLPALTEITKAAVDAAREHGLLLGILKGYATLGKITIFGTSDDITQQKRFISDLRAELIELEKVQKNLQASHTAGFLRGIFGLASPEEVKNQIASITQQLKDAQGALDVLVNKPASKAGLTPVPPPVDESTGLIKQRLANIVALEKLTAAERLQLLNDYNARGLVAVEADNAERLRITKEGLDAQIGAVKNAIKEQQRALAVSPTAGRASINVEIEKLQGEQTRLQQQARFAQVQSSQELIDAQQRLADAVAHVNEQFDKQQHNTAAAAAAQFDVANRVLAARLTTEFGADSPEVQRFEKIRDTTIAQGQLNQLNIEASNITARTAALEQNAASALQAAGLNPENELRALQAINQAREESIGPLREIARHELEIALLRGTTVDVANALKNLAAVNALAASTSDAAKATQQFAIQQRQLSLITGDEAIAEKNIASARAASAITDLDALQATDQARRDAIGPLTKMADEMERAAIASKDPAALLAVRQLRADITALAASAHSAADVFRNVFETSFVTAFDSFAQGAQNAGQAFRSFALDVVKGLEHIAAQQFAQILFGAGGLGGTGMFSWLANAFSGGAGAGSSSFAGRMAIGGITSGPTLAGESGPEAVIPLSGGRSVPVTLKGSGGGNVAVTVNVHAGGAISSGPGASDQLGVAIAAAVQREIITQKAPGGLLARV